ncbi:hypothetical protein GOV08_03510 [Candidatus Woesearchaeota archaeon]|nr:hypothetical protein [Candidatus Woesearchaeota archaeon]
MPKKKSKKIDFTPYVIAFIGLIVIGSVYFYLGGVAITKVDTAFGVDDFKIENLVIEKGYTVSNDRTAPRIIIEFDTTLDSVTTIKVDDYMSKSDSGKKFTHTLLLDPSYFEKNVSFEISAVALTGIETKIRRNVFIDNPPIPTITIS